MYIKHDLWWYVAIFPSLKVYTGGSLPSLHIIAILLSIVFCNFDSFAFYLLIWSALWEIIKFHKCPSPLSIYASLNCSISGLILCSLLLHFQVFTWNSICPASSNAINCRSEKFYLITSTILKYNYISHNYKCILGI